MKPSLLHCFQYINSLKINLDDFHNLVFLYTTGIWTTYDCLNRGCFCNVLCLIFMTSGLLWVALLLIHSFALPKTTIVKVMICRRVPDIMKNSVFSARVQTIKINIGNICDVQIIKGDNYLQIIKANLQDNQALHWCVCFRGWSPG